MKSFIIVLLISLATVGSYAQEPNTLPVNHPLQQLSFMLGEFTIRSGGTYTGSIKGSDKKYVMWRIAAKDEEAKFGLISFDSTTQKFVSAYFPSQKQLNFSGGFTNGSLILKAEMNNSRKDSLQMIFKPGLQGSILEITKEQITKSIDPINREEAWCYKPLSEAQKNELSKNALKELKFLRSKLVPPYVMSTAPKFNADSTEMSFSFKLKGVLTDASLSYDFMKDLYTLETVTDDKTGMEMMKYKGYGDEAGANLYATVKNSKGEWRSIKFKSSGNSYFMIENLK